MNREKQLLTELAAALRLRADAKKVWAETRAAALEARGRYNEQVGLVEEIQAEIETGVTGRPLLDAINERAASANGSSVSRSPPAAKTPKRAKEEAKLENLHFETTKETFDRLIEDRADPAAVAAHVGKLLNSPQDAAPDAPPAKPAAQNEDPPQDGKPFWVSADLHRELLHALMRSTGRAGFAALKKSGATNQDIRGQLEAIWPRHGRHFVPPDQSGGKHGYTIACPGGVPTFWIGACHGPGHKPTLQGLSLFERARSVLELKTPTQVAAGLREPRNTAAGTGFSDPKVPDEVPVRPQLGKETARAPRHQGA